MSVVPISGRPTPVPCCPGAKRGFQAARTVWGRPLNGLRRGRRRDATTTETTARSSVRPQRRRSHRNDSSPIRASSACARCRRRRGAHRNTDESLWGKNHEPKQTKAGGSSVSIVSGGVSIFHHQRYYWGCSSGVADAARERAHRVSKFGEGACAVQPLPRLSSSTPRTAGGTWTFTIEGRRVSAGGVSSRRRAPRCSSR